MPRLRPPSSARRTWCPARSRQLAMPEISSEEPLPALSSNRHCSSKPQKPVNPPPPVEPSISPAAEEALQEEPSLSEIPEESPQPPPPPRKKPAKKEGLDFSYLKDGLTADGPQDPEEKEARKAALGSVEAALKVAQARADRLAELAADSTGDARGRCATLEEARKLKQCIAGLGEILSCLRRRQPAVLSHRETGRCCGPRLADCPHSGRDRLAELRSRYERSLLLTPADVSWPFVHLIAPAWPAPPSAAEACRSLANDCGSA
ncbi:hypothetical protein BOX15_Mlig001573g2 [Macrostomum lignano]|uniref:Uncharacterized protein n=1 Tax=Macrostomum lignano TaxID=282301 RepID=A0A267EF14_9PLAT|nr:hypothetical protein BOX15_Mlig001573g2 [Macrostomum lignano]